MLISAFALATLLPPPPALEVEEARGWKTSAAVQLPPISTDRPDFTEGARSVPNGTTQVEAGITYETTAGIKLWTLPEALVRIGLNETTEARIGLPNYTSLEAGATIDGIADPSLGFKHELNQHQGIDVAFIGTVTFAAGDRDVRSERTTPAAALAWSTDLKQGSLGGMFGAEFPGGPALFRNTLVFGAPLSDDVGAFAEHVLDFGDGFRPMHVAHFGFTKSLGENAQLDLHFGFGLSPTAPDSFVGAGYAVRF